MNLESIILKEVRRIERQIPYDIIYIWNLKNDTNELIDKTEADSENKFVQLIKGKAEGKG